MATAAPRMPETFKTVSPVSVETFLFPLPTSNGKKYLLIQFWVEKTVKKCCNHYEIAFGPDHASRMRNEQRTRKRNQNLVACACKNNSSATQFPPRWSERAAWGGQLLLSGEPQWLWGVVGGCCSSHPSDYCSPEIPRTPGWPWAMAEVALHKACGLQSRKEVGWHFCSTAFFHRWWPGPHFLLVPLCSLFEGAQRLCWMLLSGLHGAVKNVYYMMGYMCYGGKLCCINLF